MILKQGIKGVLVAHFIDVPAVAFCAAKEKGDRFDLSLGGTIDPAGSVRTVLTLSLIHISSNDNALFQGKIVFSIEGEWFENFINLYAPDDFCLLYTSNTD